MIRVLPIGTQAPAFELPDQAGRTHRLRDLLANGPAVVYFYPKDFTPTCTAQACMVRDAFEQLVERGVMVAGINAEPVDKHARFVEKHALPFMLLSDPGKSVIKAYDASVIFGLMTSRISYYIDAAGIVRDAVKADWSVKPHAAFVQRVLARHA